MNIQVKPLGQSGFRLAFGKTIVYIDPYLSDRVRELEGEAMRRLTPVACAPEAIDDARYILISHMHLDHCDLATLLPISKASAHGTFICPNEVAQHLLQNGIPLEKIVVAGESWITLADDLTVLPVPAAHPKVERDPQGFFRCVGYVIEYCGRRIYHAGDTAPDDQLTRRLLELRPIESAFLPVNERNYYREKRGIVGNMSVREAFQLATDLGLKVVVPMHWDMFAPNSVYPEEIELMYRLIQPPFKLDLHPAEL